MGLGDFGDFMAGVFTGGANKNYDYEDSRFSYAEMYNNYYAEFVANGYNLSDTDKQKLLDDLSKQNDEQHKANVKEIDKRVALNVGINVLTTAISLALAGSSVKALSGANTAGQKMLSKGAASIADDLAEKGVSKGVANVFGEVIEKSGKSITKEFVEELAEKSGKDIFESLAEKGGRDVLEQMAKETGESALEAFAKTSGKEVLAEIAGESWDTIIKKASANGLGETIERMGAMSGSELLKELGGQSGKSFAKTFGTKTGQELIDNFALKTGKEAIGGAFQVSLKSVGSDVFATTAEIASKKLTKTELQKALNNLKPGEVDNVLVGNTSYKLKAIKDLKGNINNKVVIDVKGTFAAVGKNIGNSYNGTDSFMKFMQNTGKAGARTVSGALTIGGALSGKLLSNNVHGAGRLGLVVNGVGKLMGVAVITAPAVAGQIATRKMSEAQADELNDAITLLAEGAEYFEERNEYLTEAEKEFYEQLMADRDSDHAELLEKYAEYIDEDGNIADDAIAERFAKEYTELEKRYSDKMDDFCGKKKDFTDLTITDGIANKMGEVAGRENIDIESAADWDSNIKGVYESDSFKEGVEGSYDRVMEINAKLNDDGFWGFIDKIHDTIMHYVPPLAYVEATVRKGVDVVLDAIPIVNYDAKYAGQGIGDLATLIADDSEADYQLRQERKALLNSMEDGAYFTLDDAAARASGGSPDSEEEEESKGDTPRNAVPEAGA